MATRTVRLADTVKKLQLDIVMRSSDFDTALIRTSDVNRPGLQLTGFYDYYDPRRLQILGRVESTYLSGLRSDDRRVRFEKLLEHRPVALIICHGTPVYPECLEMAKKYDVPLLSTDRDTCEIMAIAIEILHYNLAPRDTLHGVLVEIHGEGVLIMGKSGVGKSEAALELVKRGHKLVADDAVEIKLTGRDRLIGSAPAMIRYYMELRGIGLIDVRTLYGVGSVKPSGKIDLIVNLETWEDNKAYNRLGIDTETKTILGVEVPCVTIPIRPGRNLAVILETASMNNRMKKMGYDAAKMLVESHDSSVDLGWLSM